MWTPVGVKLDIEQVDNATRTARYREGDFQMRDSCLDQRHPRPEPDHLLLRLLPEHRIPPFGWKDDEVDKLFEQSQQEIDPEKRAAQYKRIQEIYIAEAPILFLYETPYPVACSKSVKGFFRSRSATTSSSALISRSKPLEHVRGRARSSLAPRVAEGSRGVPSPSYVVTRLLQIVPTFLLIMVVVFVLVRLLPGDPRRDAGRPGDRRGG